MEQQEPLKIVELKSENVKRLKAVAIRPDGALVIIEDGEVEAAGA